MREFEISLTKILNRGLNPYVETPDNPEFLVECHNQMPSELALRPHEPLVEPIIILPGGNPFLPDVEVTVGPTPYIFRGLSPHFVVISDITAVGTYFDGAVFSRGALSIFPTDSHVPPNLFLLFYTPGSVEANTNGFLFSGGFEIGILFDDAPPASPMVITGTYVVFDSLNRPSNTADFIINVLVT